MESRDDLLLVEATIWLEKESHKGIVIGKGGDRLKHVGQAARLELEETLGRRIHLETRVKVKENWSDNARALRQLGYDVPQ
jgi:GTP-binding protein Era